ncbi:MAG: hypothetical protein ACM3X5_09095 [Bacillota bacterium]
MNARQRRQWHEEWVDRVVLPALGALSREQRELARKILLKKRDIKPVAHRPRKWDADRRLELLTDYDLLLKRGFRSAQAHRLLQDLHGTSKVPTYLREARRLFPRKTRKR